MSFLAWLGSFLLKPLLDWLYNKMASLILWGSKVYRRKREEENSNAAMGEDLKNAETKEDRDESAKGVVDNW
jgi:hypothetical protein